MRQLTAHIVDGDSANHQMKIAVTDEPDAGGANHQYQITAGHGTSALCKTIDFQNGPIKEFGVNGLTHEALLAIVMDRLQSYQAGPYACEDNEVALLLCRTALHTLQNRTRARIARNVEGTHQV